MNEEKEMDTEMLQEAVRMEEDESRVSVSTADLFDWSAKIRSGVAGGGVPG